MGCMYSVDPVMNLSTINLFALSDGWKGSQNAYRSLFGHKLEAGVQSPIPLYAPWPQHATFDVTKPVCGIKRLIHAFKLELCLAIMLHADFSNY